jgi:sulfotransferase
VRGDQPLGLAYNRIKDALHRGYRDRLHFVRFEELTAGPRQALRHVYEFLDEPYFEHDFDHVEQVTHEDDRVHGFPGMHAIRAKVEPVPPQWPQLLGEAAEPYARLEIW